MSHLGPPDTPQQHGWSHHYSEIGDHGSGNRKESDGASWVKRHMGQMFKVTLGRFCCLCCVEEHSFLEQQHISSKLSFSLNFTSSFISPLPDQTFLKRKLSISSQYRNAETLPQMPLVVIWLDLPENEPKESLKFASCLVMVAGKLEPIPSDLGLEVEYNLNRSPIDHMANREINNYSHSHLWEI